MRERGSGRCGEMISDRCEERVFGRCEEKVFSNRYAWGGSSVKRSRTRYSEGLLPEGGTIIWTFMGTHLDLVFALQLCREAPLNIHVDNNKDIYKSEVWKGCSEMFQLGGDLCMDRSRGRKLAEVEHVPPPFRLQI